MERVISLDLSKFGYRELSQIAELLEAYSDQPPVFLRESDGLTLGWNTEHDVMFLSTEDGCVGVLEDKRVVQFFSCEECGYEGTQKEALADGKDFGKYDGRYCSAECAGEDEEDE